MSKKIYNPLIKLAAISMALASASCCCNNNPNRAAAPRVVPYKSAVTQPWYPVQNNQPLPGNYVVPINEDGTNFPMQNKNPMPGNSNIYYPLYVRPFYVRPFYAHPFYNDCRW